MYRDVFDLQEINLKIFEHILCGYKRVRCTKHKTRRRSFIFLGCPFQMKCGPVHPSASVPIYSNAFQNCRRLGFWQGNFRAARFKLENGRAFFVFHLLSVNFRKKDFVRRPAKPMLAGLQRILSRFSCCFCFSLL